MMDGRGRQWEVDDRGRQGKAADSNGRQPIFFVLVVGKPGI